MKSPQQTLADWQALPRAKTLTPAVSETICAWTMLGHSLQRITLGGSNDETRLATARREELATIEHINGSTTKLRLPGKARIISWLAKGAEDARNGEETIESRFALTYSRAREAATDEAYDQIIEIEQRMIAPQFRSNPDHDPDDKDSAKMLKDPMYLDSGAGTAIIRSIQWRLARLKPAVYGDRLDINANIKETKSLVLEAPDWLRQVIGDRARLAVQAGCEDGPALIEGTAEARTPTTSGNEPDA